MGDVVSLGNETKLPIPVDRVILRAAEEHRDRPFKYVVVIGVYEDGEEYFATSEADAAVNNWYADRFKFQLQVRADAGEK